MKYSFWFINSLLLFFLSCTFTFMFFSQQQVSTRFSLEPEVVTTHEEATTKNIDIQLIYENDLFNTYHKTYPAPVQPTYVQNALPQPPAAVQPEQIHKSFKKFLPELKIKLKGIIAVDDQSSNAIILSDEQTNQQKTFTPGSIIDDAMLIKIFPNKAAFVRSNGQLETLYLSEDDVEEDVLVAQQKRYWSNVVKKVKDNYYLVDHEALAKSVKNIGTFFDVLDITTLYENGVTQGLRIGTLYPNSLGEYLGFKSGDLITHCGNNSLYSLAEQKRCYNTLLTLQFNETLIITVQRGTTKIDITYHLEDLKDPFDTSLDRGFDGKNKNKYKKMNEEELQQERIELLKKKYKFAPTTQDLKIQQKLISMNMRNSKSFTPSKKKE